MADTSTLLPYYNLSEKMRSFDAVLLLLLMFQATGFVFQPRFRMGTVNLRSSSNVCGTRKGMTQRGEFRPLLERQSGTALAAAGGDGQRGNEVGDEESGGIEPK